MTRKTVILLSLILMIFNIQAPYAGARQRIVSIPDRLYINEIDIYGLNLLDKKYFLYIFGIRHGEVSTEQIDTGIKRVFRTGLFENITVEFYPSLTEGKEKRNNLKTGTLRIIVKEHPFINRIHIKGNNHLKDDLILKNIPFKEGDILRTDRIKAAEKDLKDLYRRKGFPDAEIKIEVIELMRPDRFDININIKEGNPLIVREIRITGYTSWIKTEMETEPDDIYDMDRIKEDIERIRHYLYKKGFFNPRVGPVNFDNGKLTIHINPGRKLILDFYGNHEFSSEELEEIISLKDTEINTDTIAEASERIVKSYHKRGYVYALVSPVIKKTDDSIHVRFYINEGRRFFVKDILFEGNTLPAERLKEMLSIKEDAPFNPDLLDNYRDGIIAFYRALGYLDVKVTDMSYHEKDNAIVLKIRISEGHQSRIKGIEILGNSLLSSQELLDILSVKEGSPFNELILFDIKRKIINAYHERGYLDTAVNLSVNRKKYGVYIKVEIKEGPPYYFGKTIIRGNRQTSLKVIQRQLNYREGDPLNTKLLPQLSRKLYQMGLFRDVKITILSPYEHIAPVESPRGVKNKRDILIKLAERKQGLFEFGIGYGEYEGLRGFIDIRYNNLWGMNRSAGLRWEMSNLRSRFLLTYNEPYFLDRDLKLSSVIQYSERKEKNIDTGDVRYRVRRYSANVSVGKKLTDRIKLNLTYGYALVKTFDVEPGIVLSKEDRGTLGISSLMPGVIYDSRDNPFNPRSGILAGGSLKLASHLLFGETDFVKFNLHFSIYHALLKRTVLAFSLRGGLAESFKDTRDLPLVERYFLGGRNTVRGFPQDGLGPKSPDGTPTGGNAYVALNLELRTDVGRGFSVVTFIDSGNVWPRLSDIDGSLRVSAGVGLRYNTPVGPIRIDYGHKLDRREGESAGEIHFSIGHAF